MSGYCQNLISFTCELWPDEVSYDCKCIHVFMEPSIAWNSPMLAQACPNCSEGHFLGLLGPFIFMLAKERIRKGEEVFTATEIQEVGTNIDRI